MPMHLLIRFAPLFVLLAIGSLIDLRDRRIPNWLTMGIALAGIAQSFMAYPTVSPSHSLAGFGVGFILPLILFLLNAIGGGDVKLLAAVGAWVGPVNIILIFIAKDLVGLVIVLAQAMVQGRLRTLFRNSAVVALNLVHVREVGMDTVQQSGLSSRSIDKPLPLAVPIFIAMALLLFVRPGGF
jgi:prepilin peptidase CpaA